MELARTACHAAFWGAPRDGKASFAVTVLICGFQDCLILKIVNFFFKIAYIAMIDNKIESMINIIS